MRIEQIGDCTLYNGDCREALELIGCAYDTLISDPPYGMAFRSNHRATKHEAIANDGDAGMLQWTCGLPARHSKYIFCRWDNLVDVPKPKSLITWVKNNWSMGDLKHEHGRQTEVALFYPGPEHFFGNGRPSDVVHAPRTGNTDHPTEKPISLMEQVIMWTAGTVLDPFMGAGSTGIASTRLGRAFIGVELNTTYFDAACRRIEDENRRPTFFRARAANDNEQPVDLFGAAPAQAGAA